MKEITVTVKNSSGLHARPAAIVVNTAAKFSSKITATKNAKEVNLKSLLSLLSLGACLHDSITIKAEGADENSAIDAIITALNSLTD